ncbi:MAG: hypothetical protein ACO1QS_04860 [Verrucomicrobiota bacterium]
MDLEQKFKTILPQATDWIAATLADHPPQAPSVASFGFRRLPHYYPAELLQSTKVIALPGKLPVPPLRSWGLDHPAFADFEDLNAAGITYLDTYFVQASLVTDESLHFHELVHVLQWAHLGPERFLMTYALGLAQLGYRDSPLETMAYDLQADFEQGKLPFQVKPLVLQKLQ